MSGSSELLEALRLYKGKVNDSDRVRRMIANWESCLVIKPTDRGGEYCVSFENGLVAGVEHGTPSGGRRRVEIEASYEELLRIFTGLQNPAQSFLQGRLAVYGSEADQVKLDAISLVLWGI